MQDERGAIETRQHKTLSGGLHEIFLWDDENPVGRQRGDIPRGIDIKGVGGYIVVPPSYSRKHNREYSMVRDIKPVKDPGLVAEKDRSGSGCASHLDEAAPSLEAVEHLPDVRR